MKFVGVVVAYNPTDVIYHCIDSYLPFLKKLYVIQIIIKCFPDILMLNIFQI